jgi:amino acid permease
MFSPQSSSREFRQSDLDNSQPFIINDVSLNEDEIKSISNGDIVYEEEDYNTTSSRAFNNKLHISYCGIRGDSKLSAILNICASCVGSGCLTFPYMLDNSSIIFSIILFSIVTLCIYFSSDLLRSFVVDTKYFSFSLMTETTLGKNWLRIYCFTSILFYFFVNISYLILLYSIFQNYWENKFWKKCLFILITCPIEIILCIYSSKTAKIHLFSIFIMITFIILCILVLSKVIYSCIKEDYIYTKFSTEKWIKTKFNWEFFFTLISDCTNYIFSYCNHLCYPTLIGNLRTVNDINSKLVHNISFGIICGCYLFISFLGYLMDKSVPKILFHYVSDQNDQKENGTNNPSEKKDFFNQVFNYVPNIILFLFIFALIPVRYIIIRDGYTPLIGKKKLTYKTDVIITIICLIISNGMIFVEALDLETIFQNILSIFGGLFGVIIAFGLPVINYASVNGKKKPKSLSGYIIFGVFFIIGLISFSWFVSKL